MQRKIQVNQVLHKFSHYGIVLFILAFIFFVQAVFNILIYIMYYDLPIIPISFNFDSFLVNSNLIVGISSSIVIFILMIQAIMIHSKTHEPVTIKFIVYSIFWFVFSIGYIINWLITLPSITGIVLPNPKIAESLHYIIYISAILSSLFQLLVWISLRKFFLDRDDIFPKKSTRSIFNCLILLILTAGMVFMGSVIWFNFNNSFLRNLPIIWTSGDTYFYLWGYILPEILFIIGYSLLGYRFIKLKSSTDNSNSER